jgi:hypothetical protein
VAAPWRPDTQISALDKVQDLVNLRTLALAGNPIRELQQLQALAYLPALQELSFEDAHFAPAPIAALEGYREVVVMHLKQAGDSRLASWLECGAALGGLEWSCWVARVELH